MLRGKPVCPHRLRWGRLRKTLQTASERVASECSGKRVTTLTVSKYGVIGSRVQRKWPRNATMDGQLRLGGSSLHAQAMPSR